MMFFEPDIKTTRILIYNANIDNPLGIYSLFYSPFDLLEVGCFRVDGRPNRPSSNRAVLAWIALPSWCWLLPGGAGVVRVCPFGSAPCGSGAYMRTARHSLAT